MIFSEIFSSSFLRVFNSKLKRVFVPLFSFPLFLAVFLGVTVLSGQRSSATVNDALSFAYEVAQPYHRRYAIRQDAWGGDLGVRQKKAVTAQLFKGNEYWFWMASDVPQSIISVHLYDDQGKLAESESWRRPNPHKRYSAAASHIIPQSTGTYYAIVEVSKSPEERTPWALVYGYKENKEVIKSATSEKNSEKN